MTIQTEQERNAEAIRYTQERIRELRTMIRECDYTEDVDGNPVYENTLQYAVLKEEWMARRPAGK